MSTVSWGIGGALHDDLARAFAIGFYGALGEQESVAAAYRHGNAAISLEGLSDAERPQLRVREGIDAAQSVLSTVARATPVALLRSRDHERADTLRYMIYISRTKLDMLNQQVSMQDSNSSFMILDDIIRRLRSQGSIGTLEEPREYFEGNLEMKWGPVTFYPARHPDSDAAGEKALRSVGKMVLFSGALLANSMVAMIGSQRHMIGDPGNAAADHVAYTNPAFWAKIVTCLSAPEREIAQNMRGTFYGIRGQQREEAPAARLQFLAKTFTRQDGLLIGSPLFVALD